VFLILPSTNTGLKNFLEEEEAEEENREVCG